MRTCNHSSSRTARGIAAAAVVLLALGAGLLGWRAVGEPGGDSAAALALPFSQRWSGDLLTPDLPAAPTPEVECRALFAEADASLLVDRLQRWIDSPSHPAAEVVSWLQRLPGGVLRDEVVAALAPEFPLSDRLTLALAMTGPQQRRDLLSAAVGQWALDDPQAAVDWLARHRDDSAFAAAQGALVVAMAVDHPVEAATYAATEMTGGIEQERAVIGVVQRWTQRDPEAAAAWIGQLADGPLPLNAMEEMVRIWAGSDPAAVAVWLGHLTKNQLRDAALASFARQLAPTAPDDARFWASEIAESTLRESCLGSLFSLVSE